MIIQMTYAYAADALATVLRVVKNLSLAGLEG